MANVQLRILCTTAALAMVGLASCSLDVHDNTINIPDATINVTSDADLNNVQPGSAINVNLTAENVYLIEPSATPPPEHVDDAGHFQIYLDDLESTPLVVTAQATATVTIPANTPPGPHKVKCRLHRHDGMPTSTVVELSIMVMATVGT